MVIVLNSARQPATLATSDHRGQNPTWTLVRTNNHSNRASFLKCSNKAHTTCLLLSSEHTGMNMHWLLLQLRLKSQNEELQRLLQAKEAELCNLKESMQLKDQVTKVTIWYSIDVVRFNAFCTRTLQYQWCGCALPTFVPLVGVAGATTK